MGRVRRQSQAGVNLCTTPPSPLFPPSLKLHLFHPNQLLSPLLLQHHGFRNIFSPLPLKVSLLGSSHSHSPWHSSLLPMKTSCPTGIRLSGSKRSQIFGLGLQWNWSPNLSLKLTHCGDFCSWASVSPSVKWGAWSSWLCKHFQALGCVRTLKTAKIPTPSFLD